jgi:hypothetical protein
MSQSKDYMSNNIDIFDFIPENIKNELNSSFSRNLFNKFLTKEESVKIYGLIGDKQANDTDTTPLLPHGSAERRINSLVPLIYGKIGAEEDVLAFSDVMNKAKLIGLDVTNYGDWGSCQSFNFVPPIDIDKFINFSSYYWTGKLTNFSPAWNTTLDPEYYVIQRPKKTAIDKFPVEAITFAPIVLTGSGHTDEDWKVVFTSATGFTVTGVSSGISGNGVIDTLYSSTFITFKISSGSTPFTPGDTFVISTKDLTSSYTFTYSGHGNGGISGIRGATSFQKIPQPNGSVIQTYDGMRVCVAHQTNPAENGIYVVKSGVWEIADDCVVGSTGSVGMKFYVFSGDESLVGTWKATSFSAASTTFEKISSIRNVSEWTQYNFWIHRDDAESLGIDINETIQAKRPIIEYSFDLEMNTDAENGLPQGGNVTFNAVQNKVKFNQLPLFNLYLSNGNFAEKVSPIFYYEENSQALIDDQMKRRIVLDSNDDYVFSQGCVLDDGQFLFFKVNGEITSVWVPGPDSASITDILFSSASRQITDVKTPAITIENVFSKIKTSSWTGVANSTTSFTLTATQYPEVNVDIPFDTKVDVKNSLGDVLFSITVASGSVEIPTAGVQLMDNFKFKSLNKEIPRYVTGETLSTASEVAVDEELVNGVWTTPFQLSHNPYHENRKTIHFGDLINHFKGIIANQPGFSGSAFGRNNFRTLDSVNLGLGGNIKEHNTPFNKFVGLINQTNISPLSLIDFAETQYAQALNSVNEYVNKYAIDILNSYGAIEFNGNTETTSKIDGVVDDYCSSYKDRVDVSTYLGDSSSVIPNWPATLPTLGLCAGIQPHFGFDNELGLNVIVHHDGHLSPKNQRNVEFDRQLARQKVLRSDGTTTAGIFAMTMPANPYMRQLWFNSDTSELKIFDVVSDTVAPTKPNDGDLWYNRTTGKLSQWLNNVWNNVQDLSFAWKLVETDKILNSIIMNIETRLFNSIHPNQTIVWDAKAHTTNETLKFELAKFAAKYGYDPYAPDYSSTNPFTWNYKQANFPEIGTGIARWYDVYEKYFQKVTGTQFTTCRPNLEPWKLLGVNDIPNNFIETFGGLATKFTLDSTKAFAPVDYVLDGELTDVNACPSTVDEIQLRVGNRILVTSGANLGIYSVTSVGTGNDGVWEYTSDFNQFTLVQGNNVLVNSGYYFNNTEWVYIDGSFQQYRTWEINLWIQIQQAFPNLKLCVNIYNEQLLAPYTDPLSAGSQFALLNSVPAGISDSYAFNDNGPTEMVWKKSLEYTYSLLRSSMKILPLDFIECTWGEPYRSVRQLKLDKQANKKVSHKEFLLHGEMVNLLFRARIIGTAAGTVFGGENLDIILTCDLVGEEDFFLLEVNGEKLGHINTYVHAGKFNFDFSKITINDGGRGFQIGDQISFSITPDGIVNEVFTPATRKVVLGIGQFYPQLLKFNSNSITDSKNSIMFRGWDTYLGYRFGAFINTDTIDMSCSNFDIPMSLCNTLIKVSPFSKSAWIHALRIQLVQIGTTVLNNSIYQPVNKGDDWVFRIETYYSGYPQLSYYDVDTSGDFVTFNALSSRRSTDTWDNYTTNKSVKTTTVPLIITGIQNVVNFLFGYSRYLTDIGWRVNFSDNPDIDNETGRIINWQLEIEKFIDSVYDNLSVGSGLIFNPFMKDIWYLTSQGLTSQFETIKFLDVEASQFAYDITGTQIGVDKLKVVREEDKTMVVSDTPIYGMHVNVDIFEHTVLFPYYLDNSNRQDLLFDPFLGLKISKILVQGERQNIRSGRPSFGGFFMVNNKMKKNFIGAVDDLGNLFNSDKVFDDPVMSRYALSLFGYSDKGYFDGIVDSKKNQFNFWRGLIKAKGTNQSVEAFLKNKVYEDAKIDEYWAFRIAQYGDARTKSFPELKLLSKDSLTDNTRFQFTDGVSVPQVTGFTQVSETDSSRWINLDDLNELKARGMYFDAISVGKIIINEKPEITNLVNKGIGAVQFATGTQVVNLYMKQTTILVTMSDVVAFTVTNQTTGYVYGTGEIGQLFTCAAFSFKVENDLYDMIAGDTFTFDISNDINRLIKLPFIADMLVASDTTNIDFVTDTIVRVKKANTSISIEGFGPQKPKFSPIKFFDYKNDTFLGNVSFWHPAIGQHTPEAFEIISMVSPVDPAKYNQTGQVINNPNYDVLKPWGSSEVGRVWWNNNGLEYKPYFDKTIYPNIENRLSKWGSLAEYSSVEVYEWIESDVPPDQYVAQVLADAKDSTKTQDQKKSGEVAISKLLTRTRTWNVRPIAWQQNNDSESPFLTTSLFNKVMLTSSSIGDTTVVLNYGRFADMGISSGMSLAAWDSIADVPQGQLSFTGTLSYIIGGETSFMKSVLPPAGQITNADGNTVNTAFSIDISNRASSVGKALGPIGISTEVDGTINYVVATEINTGKYQKLPINDVAAGTSYVEYDFSDLGVKLKLSFS